MKPYIKKEISKDDVMRLRSKYGVSPLDASVLARRGITKGSDLRYYLESDMRFTHCPFMFSAMEDAVERITDAIDEGEKVLIFGDRDVDGITSTAILYGYLKELGLDVQWRLPIGEDSYGLSLEAVESFAEEYGSLIITVDCGISCAEEVKRANELGLDVIITDHHNPPEVLPEAAVIIDPKMPDSGYPFQDISGAAVAYKLVSALRFSKTDLYNQDICLLTAEEESDGKIRVDCVKTRNLVKKSVFSQAFFPGSVSVSDTKIPAFLSGQQIFTWNAKKTAPLLKTLFGSAVDFQMLDIQGEISKIIPAVGGKELSELKNVSRIARYEDTEISTIDTFFNIFVTFAELSASRRFPKHEADAVQDVQLVGIAALADIMPMKNENRIFVKNAIKSINSSKIRKGISDLIARTDLAGKTLNSTDLSWKIIPLLNAAGRMGQADLGLRLLLESDGTERSRLAGAIIAMNEERKNLVSQAEQFTNKQSEETFSKFAQRLCIVHDERINKGITGILAAKMMNRYNVPSIAVTFTEDKQTAVGSMRSCRSVVATEFLEKFGVGFFLNYGGHNAAAGFSFESAKLNDFLKKAEQIASELTLSKEDEAIAIAAELPPEYITESLLKTVDLFEPYGEQNAELIFLSRNIKIADGITVGKSERQHLKLTFDCGKCRFPAMFWGEAERLNRDFKKGDNISILYTVGRNTFNGAVTPQMILLDTQTES